MNENEVKTKGTAEDAGTANGPTIEELQAELERLKTENGKLKNAQSNASADASRYKKALQERMSEQEKAAAETQEMISRIKAENEELKRNQTLAEYTAGFLGLGYSEELAKNAASAMFDGKFSDFVNVHKQFTSEHDKALAADAIRNVARPGAGAAEKPAVSKEQFAKMNYGERAKLFEEQPELYQELIR